MITVLVCHAAITKHHKLEVSEKQKFILSQSGDQKALWKDLFQASFLLLVIPRLVQHESNLYMVYFLYMSAFNLSFL